MNDTIFSRLLRSIYAIDFQTNMKRILPFGVLIILLAVSCRTPQQIAYFQGLEHLNEEQKTAMNQKYVPRICIDDALIINVTSPDRTSAIQFSPPPWGYSAPGESEIGISATTQNLYTYLVDEFGEINFPELGRIKVVGLSINEATRMLEQMIWETAPKAVVNVQITNFKVGIIGEVMMPEVYHIKTSRISILELIARAGDLTVYGDRKNVWLVRDNNGEKVHVKMDLTDPEIFASPYYYLQQNDMVYVMPNETQKRNATHSLKDNTRAVWYGAIATSILTSVSILASALVNIRGQNK